MHPSPLRPLLPLMASLMVAVWSCAAQAAVIPMHGGALPSAADSAPAPAAVRCPQPKTPAVPQPARPRMRGCFARS